MSNREATVNATPPIGRDIQARTDQFVVLILEALDEPVRLVKNEDQRPHYRQIEKRRSKRI